MTKDIIKSPEDVASFLSTTKKVLENDEDWQINMAEWAGKINKTRHFIAEKGLTRKDVKQAVGELLIRNYCYTRDDVNSNFPNEQFWFFGLTKNFIDEDVDLNLNINVSLA